MRAGGRHGNEHIKALIRCLALAALFQAAEAASPEIDTPRVVLSGVAFDITMRGVTEAAPLRLRVGDAEYSAVADASGSAVFSGVTVTTSGAASLSLTAPGLELRRELRVLPGWISVMPPVLAIAFALALRNVIPALLVGIWFGATALHSFSAGGAFRGMLESFEIFVVRALADEEHAAIILFSMMIGGMVGIITRNGGMASIVALIVSRARSALSGQLAVATMGLMIFFDDYSNTLVVGNTARPLTDRLRISREKLAYIVDSTAAPVVCIALITTWIGYEVGLIAEAMSGIPDLDLPAYNVFLNSIPYSFYPILAVFFVFAVAGGGRDFGPMYQAEIRARGGQVSPLAAVDLPSIQGEALEPKDNIPLRAVNAFVPLIVLIAALVAGLYVTGQGETLTEIVGSANAYQAMLWASLLGALSAAVMTIAQRILTAHETVDAWYGGVRAMLFAMIVLVLAWALSAVTGELNTAAYLVSILADSLPPALVPATAFVLSALTAFTTGTSWGTMGILMPLLVPLTWAVLGANGMADPAHLHILYSAIACNLAGAVWGDHCSPISDTTVLSSMASGCDHIEHVRTQMPYALLVGAVALSVGTIPAAFGLHPLFALAIGAALLMLALRVFGRRAGDARGQ